MWHDFKKHCRAAADPDPATLFSREALQRAWQSVRRHGLSPGVDKVSVPQFAQRLDAELSRLREDVLSGGYRPQKALRFFKTKPSGKQRPLTIWAVRDRVAQRVVHDHLTLLLEDVFLPCSFGFRPGRRVDDAAHAVRAALASQRHWLVDADIADCFDSVPSDALQTQLRSVVPSVIINHLIGLWLETPILGQPGRVAGVSQGSVLSPQLTNLYLHRFDQVVLTTLPQATLVRFADDFVILCRRKAEAQWALLVARQTLAGLRLRLNAEKTRLIHADEGFTFLGVTFEGKGR